MISLTQNSVAIDRHLAAGHPAAWSMSERAAMKAVTIPEPTRAEAACRHLAIRVIEQALRDLSDSSTSDADRESARGFLSGSPMLYRWCELANLNASWMVGRATRLMARSGQLRIRRASQDDTAAKHACIGEPGRQGNHPAADLERSNNRSAVTELVSPRRNNSDRSTKKVVPPRT
jgi:hypothetical protein